jgi:hypothetical protein
VFEATQDALGDSHGTTAGAATEPLARQGSKTGRWSILSRKSSTPTGAATTGAGAEEGQSQQEQLEQARELEFFRGECLRQGRELQGAAAAARQARQALNLQTFKSELLIDLVRGCNC